MDSFLASIDWWGELSSQVLLVSFEAILREEKIRNVRIVRAVELWGWCMSTVTIILIIKILLLFGDCSFDSINIHLIWNFWLGQIDIWNKGSFMLFNRFLVLFKTRMVVAFCIIKYICQTYGLQIANHMKCLALASWIQSRYGDYSYWLVTLV